MKAARPPKRAGRDRARGIRRALVILAASYAGLAGLGAGALAAAGGFSDEGALAREARGVGPLFVGEPLNGLPGGGWGAAKEGTGAGAEGGETPGRQEDPRRPGAGKGG